MSSDKLPENKLDHYTRLCKIIRAVNPDISEDEVRELAAAVLADIEITITRENSRVVKKFQEPKIGP